VHTLGAGLHGGVYLVGGLVRVRAQQVPEPRQRARTAIVSVAVIRPVTRPVIMVGVVIVRDLAVLAVTVLTVVAVAMLTVVAVAVLARVGVPRTHGMQADRIARPLHLDMP
jgi:hypothetical protein